MSDENKEVVSDEFMEPPDDLKPDTDPETQVEDEPTTEGDTDSDTATADTKDDTPDEVEEVFKAVGLDKKYANPKEALRALPHLNDRLGWVENQLYNKPAAEQPKKVEKRDPQAILEELNTDPEQAVKKLTAPEIEEQKKATEALYGKILDLERRNAVAEIPELRDVLPYFKKGEYPPPGKNKYWDAMLDVSRGNPTYRGLYDHEIIPDVFERIKDKVKATDKPKVKAVPDKVKASANTAGGPKKSPTEPNWNTLSSQQRLEKAERLGLVSDE